MINKFFKLFCKGLVKKDCKVFSIKQHVMRNHHLPKNVLKIINRLDENNFQAFVVGGSVRDVLLGVQPKDFDIVTDARPAQIAKLFRNCRLIGKRFPLAHIYFGQEIIETATFRAKVAKYNKSNHGQILQDDNFGSLEEDFKRRDFSINALYYNPITNEILDYVDGIKDLKKGIVRLLGYPEERYQEDPVRMIRAIRFSCKLPNFKIHKDTYKPIKKLSGLLANIPPARLFEEYMKLFLKGAGVCTFKMLYANNLFRFLFPITNKLLDDNSEKSKLAKRLVIEALQNTDNRFLEQKFLAPGYLIGVFLWLPLQERVNLLYKDSKLPYSIVWQMVTEQILQEQQKTLAIPRKFSLIIHDMWNLQRNLSRLSAKKVLKALKNPKFRAGYDFLCLRVFIEPELQKVANWWTKYLAANEKTRKYMRYKLTVRQSNKNIIKNGKE